MWAPMALNDVEHGGELAAVHRALFAIGELDPQFIEGAGERVPVIDEPCDGHRLAGEHRLIADPPSVKRLFGQWCDVSALPARDDTHTGERLGD